MTTIAFTADLHVDAYGSRLDPETGLNARLVDYLNMVRFVALQAFMLNARALIVAGDFTERRHPAPWLVSHIRDALSNGPERQVYLRGNHDGEIAGGSIVSLLDYRDEATQTLQTGVSRPRCELVADDVVIAAIPYLSRHWLRAQPGWDMISDAEVYRALGEQFLTIARGLYAESHKRYPDAACVLVCHQTLAGAELSESQAAFLGDLDVVVDARALAAIGFEAVVAGHLHRHQVVVAGSCPVLYAGSIERVDFGEESEPKGFIVADVAPGRFDWRFIETPARRFVTLDGLQVEDLLIGRDPVDVTGAIVRVLDLEPDLDPARIRANLEAAGAFEVTEIRRARELTESAAAMPEGLTPEQALEAYFAGDADAPGLIERGRGILAGLAS